MFHIKYYTQPKKKSESLGVPLEKYQAFCEKNLKSSGVSIEMINLASRLWKDIDINL